MNTSDILINRRWNFYKEQAPKISREIYNLLQCYDEETPFLEFDQPDRWFLPVGPDGTIFLHVQAKNNVGGYKVYLYYDRDWQEIQNLGLLCEIYSTLSFMRVWKEPVALEKNMCIINLSKLPED